MSSGEIDEIYHSIDDVLSEPDPTVAKLVEALAKYPVNVLADTICEVFDKLADNGYTTESIPSLFKVFFQLQIPNLYTIIANCKSVHVSYVDEAAESLGLDKRSFLLRYGFHNLNPKNEDYPPVVIKTIRNVFVEYVKTHGIQTFINNVLQNANAYYLLYVFIPSRIRFYRSAHEFTNDVSLAIELNVDYKGGIRPLLRLLRLQAEHEHIAYDKDLEALAKKYGATIDGIKLTLIYPKEIIPEKLNDLYSKVKDNPELLQYIKSVYHNMKIPVPNT